MLYTKKFEQNHVRQGSTLFEGCRAGRSWILLTSLLPRAAASARQSSHTDLFVDPRKSQSLWHFDVIFPVSSQACVDQQRTAKRQENESINRKWLNWFMVEICKWKSRIDHTSLEFDNYFSICLSSFKQTISSEWERQLYVVRYGGFGTSSSLERLGRIEE